MQPVSWVFEGYTVGFKSENETIQLMRIFVEVEWQSENLQVKYVG